MSAPSYQGLEKGHAVSPIPSKQSITPEPTLAALKANIDTAQALHVRIKQELTDAERAWIEQVEATGRMKQEAARINLEAARRSFHAELWRVCLLIGLASL
ncbi:uncharacterized protein MYCGRDRAFT_95515 [Zymoseptoria tritici IPO323]|uniref:Uncharacterized protein n=1 Tax=Zymoseptoria tritici (strain CBS 115943 / IPO323) TaxID=336722 RepID=F9XJV0_ZYMTI|nr:uncharacterized protein MYCGRDRAFT_95515 [Zymoseptoria tritici IPO323]EGP84252.1 hypothetical protein MYCGRDRAFT_95515 [Zymoseptoria tritici IPO323]